MDKHLGSIDKKVLELGYQLPYFVKSAGDYLLIKKAGQLLFLSGVTCKVNGELMVNGKVGDSVTVEKATKATEICILNHLKILQDYLQTLDKVEAVVKLTGYVNCTSDFSNISKIIDAGSGILNNVFGECGKHVRSAIGVESLPSNATVETELIVMIKE